MDKNSFAKAFFWATGKKPYQYQVDFIEKIYFQPRVVVVKSRRIGITYAAAVFSFIMAVNGGKKILSVFPSLRQTVKFMEYVQNFWRHVNIKTDFEKGFEIRNTKTEIAFSNGGEIIALPNNPETARGYGADWIFVDEVAHFPNINDIWNSILPSITRGGNVALISTPRGATGLFYEKFNDVNYEKLNIPWSSCPDFSEKIVNEIRKDLTIDIFEQEYNCVFLESADSYFPYGLTTPCIGEMNGYHQYGDFSLGIDIGRKRDLTAITGIKKIQDKFYLTYSELFKNVEYEKQLNAISKIIEEKNPKQVFIDQTGIGAMMSEILLKRYGSGRITPITFNKENKNDMMVFLRKNFEDKTLTIPNDDMLINSLQSIKREETAAGIKYDVDRNDEIGHADEAISLSMALYSFKIKSEPKHLDLDLNTVI